MALYQFKSYGNTVNPDKLIIFIHGYKSSMDEISAEAALLAILLKQAVIITPQSNKIHKNNKIRYWYNVSDYDIGHKRRNPETPLNEIVDIYNAAGEQLSQQAAEMNTFIDEMQQIFKIDDENTYIAGFSQGAMMAIYTALSRYKTIGGCFALSGIVAGKDCLEKELRSKPKVYMLHGKEDITVQYKTLDFSIDWLQKHNVLVEDLRYSNLAHKITNSEIELIAKVINKNGQKHQ